MNKIQVINKSNNELPKFETPQSAGADVRAFLDKTIVLKPMQRVAIPTGLFFQIPIGFEVELRPRSGLAKKYGITMINSPATIDADYRGEVHILLINLSESDFVINSGDRLCQMLLKKVDQFVFEEVDKLEDTIRGSGGFGHTGIS